MAHSQSSSLTQEIGDKVMANDERVIILDLDSTRRNFDGDATLIRDIAQIFVEDVPPLIQQLVCLRTRLHAEQAADAVLLEEARRLAHSLKGLAGTFGAEPLGSLLAELEQEPKLLVADDGQQRLQVLESIAQDTVVELGKCLNHDF